MSEELPTIKQVVLTADTSNDQLLEVMARMLPLVEESQMGCVVTVSGYDDDPRELDEVPEVMDLFRRMLNLGFISLLEGSTYVPEMARPPFFKVGLGAFEVWALGKGRKIMSNGFSITQSDMRRFIEEWQACNRICETNIRKAKGEKPLKMSMDGMSRITSYMLED